MFAVLMGLRDVMNNLVYIHNGMETIQFGHEEANRHFS